MEITLNLPENIYQSFQKLAEKTSRSVDELIAEKLKKDYWAENTDAEESVADLSDSEVLELANLKLSARQDKRMSQLLENQRERRITASEKIELESLMELYRKGNIRKAQGGLEAIRRGLIATYADLQ